MYVCMMTEDTIAASREYDKPLQVDWILYLDRHSAISLVDSQHMLCARPKCRPWIAWCTWAAVDRNRVVTVIRIMM